MLSGLCRRGTISKYQNGMTKVARRAFNIGEVWNQACCHSNKTITLILQSTISRILLQRINSDTNWLRYIFFNLVDQNLIERIIHGVQYVIFWLICIFLLWNEEIFESSKLQFSSHAGFLFLF